MKNVLKVENVTMQFGGVVAVDNLTMEVNEGEIVALIGPNGAGKTTAFNVITGVYAPTNGRVCFNEKCIVRNHPTGKMKKIYRGEDPAMYIWVQRLYPAIHDFWKTGDITHISNWHFGIFQSLHGTSGRNDLHARC